VRILKETVKEEALKQRLDTLLSRAESEKRLTDLNIEEIFPRIKVEGSANKN